MKIVKGYTVAGQLLVQGHTDLVAKVGDIVRLYLDQVSDPELPEFIRATVETPIIPLQNGTQTSYGFSYDETLLDGAITRLRAKDIVNVLVYSTQGRSAYESYLITTDDDPVLTEAEWVVAPGLSNLSDVAISSPVSGQSLFRNGSNLWVNRAIVSADVSDASTGGNGSVGDGGKLVRFNSGGGISTLDDGYGYGVYASSNMGNGLIANSQDGNGALISSNSSNGINVISASGTYHALFGDTASDRSFIARVNGALGWFRGVFTGRIIAPETLADNVTWTLPTTGGNLARSASATGTIASVDVSDASKDPVANTVAKRDADGGGVAFGTENSTYGVSGISSGRAVYGFAYSNGVGVYGYAHNDGTGIQAVSASGTYHALFGDTDDNRSFIAQLKGALGWFRGAFTGRIEAQATLTANQTYTLPDSTGTLPTVPAYADLTAANAAALGAGTFFWNLALKKLQVTTA